MMRRAMMIVVMALAVMPAAGCPSPGKDEPAATALDGLQSPDELKAREAIKQLGELSKTRNLLAAVGPLTAAMNDPGHDYYTRSLVPDTLALIAKSCLNYQTARLALAPLEETLMKDRNDLIRAAAARGLARSGYPQVQRPLELASLADDSILVRKTALDALKGLTGGVYQPPSTEVVAADPVPADKGRGGAASPPRPLAAGPTPDAPECVSPETDRWLRQHVIFVGGKSTRPPVCGATPGAGGER